MGLNTMDTKEANKMPPEVIAAYWKLKVIINRKEPVDKPVVYALLKALAPLIGDTDWPDLSMFDKLFIDP